MVPVQLSGWLKIEFLWHEDMLISSETIYKSLYIRSRKLLDIALMNKLHRANKIGQSKRLLRRGDRGTISIVNGISIHKRPSEIDERSVSGHWVGDLISGSGNTHIAILVDRKTRFTMLLKLDGKDASSVKQALIKQFKNIPKILRRSLTWDRGMELAKHQEFTDAAGMPVYFCDPQSPGQRGTNENTNQFLRQYFPKKTCLKQHSMEMHKQVADQLNRRLRKTLRFTTPQTAILYAVALTG